MPLAVVALSIVHFWSKEPDASTQTINNFDLFAFSGTEGRTSKGSTVMEQEGERWDLNKNNQSSLTHLWQGFNF